MKKLCFVTSARSEYGLLKWLMYEVKESEDYELQLIVTGGHLLEEQGYTIEQIIEDGFNISLIVDSQLDTSSTARIAESMGRMAEGFAKAFEKLRPEYLVVLGDRYELLPICNTAFVMRIPIIHISGGDVTEGAIDNGIRNAVTMLADYHFPGTQDSADNIIRMRNSPQNVWVVGEPGLDVFYKEKLLSRTELAVNLGIDNNLKWILMTFHAETNRSLEYNLNVVKQCVLVLLALKEVQIVATYSNADYGGKEINSFLEKTAKENNRFLVVPSLGNIRYLSFMNQAKLVIGNSSSGIVEAPTLKIPVVNIGDRQTGRYLCSNIISCNSEYNSIETAVHKALTVQNFGDDLNYWGDGHTAEKIIEIIKREIC